jgi:hypothetical protein
VSLARQLEEALTQVAEALETGDAVAAALAAERASTLSLEGMAAGARVAPEALPALRGAQARAERLAGAVQERLVRELGLSSTGRRAATAYRP